MNFAITSDDLDVAAQFADLNTACVFLFGKIDPGNTRDDLGGFAGVWFSRWVDCVVPHTAPMDNDGNASGFAEDVWHFLDPASRRQYFVEFIEAAETHYQ